MRISDWSSDVCSSDLDLGLPEVDGLTVLDRWRKEGKTTPVLVLTARDSWSDKVAGLDAGADDYLAKPFQTEELIARLRALIRRASGNASSELMAGPVRLDTRRSEEHTSELQSLMRISYAVFCLKKKNTEQQQT